MNYLNPQPPFVWPEPRVLADVCSYERRPPFSELAGTSRSVFGIVSAITAEGVEFLESLLRQSSALKADLIVMVYPACATRRADLTRLLQIAESASDQLSVHIYPLEDITDRATNALCFLARNSDAVHVVTGPSEDFGMKHSHSGQINFVFWADPILVEAYKRYFDWLWATSQDITAEGVTQIPALVLPAGTEAGARLWRDYLDACQGGTFFTEAPNTFAEIDPDTGHTTIRSSDGTEIPSPVERIGFKKLDPLAEKMARLYEKGTLVSIDKLSKIPPLDAPLDPRLFGERSEIQKGKITRKVSMRISIIGDRELEQIKARKNEVHKLLTMFTFGLADNMRWMPYTAREPFEAELKRLDEEGRGLISSLMQGSAEDFIDARRDSVVTDINAMYTELGGRGQVPKDVIDRVVDSLKDRFRKAEMASFVPNLSHSTISFASTEGTFVSPWGQAYSLLSDIAVFPRKVLTDNFFLRGVRVPEDDLIEVMNVADDALCRDLRARYIRDRCRAELDLLSKIEKASIEARDRCELVWQILDGDSFEAIGNALTEKVKSTKADTN